MSTPDSQRARDWAAWIGEALGLGPDSDQYLDIEVFVRVRDAASALRMEVEELRAEVARLRREDEP